MAKRVIRWLLIFLLAATMQQVHGQVLIIPEVPASGIIVKQQLMSVMINNISGQRINVVLSISVLDKATSQPLLEANSGLIVLDRGVKRLMYNDLAPLQYSAGAPGFGTERQLTQPLPVGEYQVCYKLTDPTKNAVLASECLKITAEPLAPPQLIYPDNEAMVAEPRPVLSWTPPAPVYMFNNLSYDIIVSPLYGDQSPQEALQRNLPVMTTMSINNSLMYPPAFTDLLPGKTYAWQVVARDGERPGGKSEVWTFTVMPDSVVKIISNAPYVKLQKENVSTTVLQQGVLKMEYFNSSDDSTVKVEVHRVTDGKYNRRQSLSFNLHVEPGQNFLEYRINNRMRLDENALYEVKVYNNRKESWYMKFSPKYYF
jgi:hypothetical protein